MILTAWTPRLAACHDRSMGSRNPERDRLLLRDYLTIIDWHRQYEGWQVLVVCAAPGCSRQRCVRSAEVVRMRNPPDTVAQWKARLVCQKCGGREFNMHPRFVGERR